MRYLILLLSLLIINSCCKSKKCKCRKEWGENVSDCTPVHFGPFPLGGAKDYLYFKRGSWWVYRNSLSGETDSIYTEQCDTFVVDAKGNFEKWKTMTYTTIGYHLRSDVNNVDYIYNRIAWAPDLTSFKDHGYSQTQQKAILTPTDSRGPYLIFTYPFQNNPMADQLMMTSYPVMSIQGNQYNNVISFQSDISDNTVQLPTKLSYGVVYGGVNKYYWAKNYGLVQIETMLNKTSDHSVIWQKWELVKCHLEH